MYIVHSKTYYRAHISRPGITLSSFEKNGKVKRSHHIPIIRSRTGSRLPVSSKSARKGLRLQAFNHFPTFLSILLLLWMMMMMMTMVQWWPGLLFSPALASASKTSTRPILALIWMILAGHDESMANPNVFPILLRPDKFQCYKVDSHHPHQHYHHHHLQTIPNIICKLCTIFWTERERNLSLCVFFTFLLRRDKVRFSLVRQ